MILIEEQKMDPALELLRSRARSEILDYGFVMDCLQAYSSPRKKLTQLLKTGALIRIKKGYKICRNTFIPEKDYRLFCPGKDKHLVVR